MSSSMPKYLRFVHSLQNASLMDRTVVSVIFLCSLREKTRAAAVTPWIDAYFPILARADAEYLAERRILVLFWYTFTNTYFGKSIAIFLLVLLTITIPHFGWFTKEILNTLVNG